MYSLIICMALFTSTVFAGSDAMTETHLECITKSAAKQGYDSDFTELLEMVYGKGFLSQGGKESIQHMIGKLDLNGKKVLDIGSGIGGPSLCLAEKYFCDVTAVEPQKWMVDKALANLAENKEKLKGHVDFIYMEMASNLKQFAGSSFDVIIAKESLLHIPLEAKQGFLSEIHRVLKPSGSLVIMDWLQGPINHSAKTKKMMEQDGLAFNLVTSQEYIDMLTISGFTQIQIEDTTLEHITLSQENVDSIKALKEKIVKRYGVEVYKECLESWSAQKNAFQSQEILISTIRAAK